MIARRTALVGLALLPALPARASYPEYRLPDDLVARRVTFYSEGTPLVGHFVQARAQAGQRLPTIILCQGTGGLQYYHLAQAITFARAGYTVMTFDYRGWGQSRGRLVPAGEVRETVDPLEQSIDGLAAIAFAAGEPEVDIDRLGLWGTSLGGGIVAYVMVMDWRVKAVVAQVGAYDLRRAGAGLAETRAIATRRAHGDLPYPAPQPRVPGQLHGHMVREHYQIFAPIEDLGHRPNLPAVLVIDAANDELIDIRQQGQRFFERLGGPKERVVLPGIRHYDIYRGEPLEQARKLALDWYNARLK
jgi:alpha-beta hydrolase superfamily lysophospholipase